MTLKILESEREIRSEGYLEEKACPDPEEEEEDYPGFRVADIMDSIGLAVKIRGANNLLSRFIFEQFSVVYLH